MVLSQRPLSSSRLESSPNHLSTIASLPKYWPRMNPSSSTVVEAMNFESELLSWYGGHTVNLSRSAPSANIEA